MKKILLISHDATLTGAPILLINLIKCLSANKDFETKVVIKKDRGPLVSSFKSLAPTFVWKTNKNKQHKSVLKAFKELFSFKFYTNNKIQKWIDESDLVVSNTITNGDFIGNFSFDKTKLVSYVHELKLATKFFTNPADLEKVLKQSSSFFVPSAAVADYVSIDLGVPKEKVAMLNYYIPELVAMDNFDISNITPANKGAFKVGMIGTFDWRKGADIFILIVKCLFEKYPEADVVFIWQGLPHNSIHYERLMYEAALLGLTEKIVVNEPSSNVKGFFSEIDLLLLTSKEDPYPLVVLEAASFGKPAICFAKAGGAEEFVEDDAGSVVDFLNIEGIADSIFKFYSSESIYTKASHTAYKKYKERHLNPELIQSQILSIWNYASK